MPYNKILSDNEIENPDYILPGQSLVIDTPTTAHIVKSGESLYKIALQYNLSTQDIISANPDLSFPYTIYPGQIINISQKKLGTIEVNGYSYPSINLETLNKTLEYLTYISIFSYQANTNGNLDLINDQAIIDTARNAGVAPVMTVTNKNFSSYVANQILNSYAAQTTLLNNIVFVLNTKNYYALNLDFEYIYPDDKNAYNQFLKRTTELLNSLGYPVFTALAPKISKTQQGLLYEAHDYDFHGQYASRVILMTYEWGYTYGPPMAVSPVDQVKKVLDYAVTAIPSDKILMGIPNYAYDWVLPWISGVPASVISNITAINRAMQYGAAIKFDPKAQVPYYNYYDPQGRLHVVWFDDARSIKAKLLLINEYNLAGASYWTIGRFFPQNWLILNSLYNVKKISL